MSESRPPRGIDPRGPRFVAGVTAVLLLVDVFLGLVGASAASAPRAFGWFAYAPLSDASFSPDPSLGTVLLDRALSPGFLLLVAITLLFLWGVLSPRTAPWAAFYRAVIQPRLAPPTELEDPRPPRFAQGVGLLVTAIGIVLHLSGVPFAIPIFAGLAFVAAFLNAAFGLCLGCQLYLLLQRAGIVGRARPS